MVSPWRRQTFGLDTTNRRAPMPAAERWVSRLEIRPGATSTGYVRLALATSMRTGGMGSEQAEDQMVG